MVLPRTLPAVACERYNLWLWSTLLTSSTARNIQVVNVCITEGFLSFRSKTGLTEQRVNSEFCAESGVTRRVRRCTRGWQAVGSPYKLAKYPYKERKRSSVSVLKDTCKLTRLTML